MTRPSYNDSSSAKGFSHTQYPNRDEVNNFHHYDDMDSRPEAHHHSLGTGRNNASEGSHIHDGITSRPLLDSITLTGSRATYNPAREAQIVAALVLLGAVDGTST